MLKFAFVFFAVFLLSSVSSADIKDQDKVKLQLALMDYIEANQRDDAFVFFDAKQKKLVHLYPANLHPMVVPADGFYFLCADFRTASGEKLDVDFIAINSDGEYKVVQTLLNQRAVVREMMKAN
ncbi:MAG: hypothetical protein ABJN40_07990 [Sneathiella sp.]